MNKEMTLIAHIFLKSWNAEDVVRKCPKSLASADPSTSNMVNGPKHCRDLHNSTFIIFADPGEEN